MSEFILHGRPGWGSAIVEAQLAWYGLPYRLVDSGDLLDSDEARARMRPLNPLAQVPVLVLPAAAGTGSADSPGGGPGGTGGMVMTESAAITLYLADLTGREDLVPGPKAAERAAFLRWLVYLVANVYPTFTYGDVPTRFVKAEGAAEGFRAEVDAYAQRLWRVVDEAAAAPHFLGTRFSALDLYLAVMTRWRPGAKWFAEHAPRLDAAARSAARMPAVAAVMAANFPVGN